MITQIFVFTGLMLMSPEPVTGSNPAENKKVTEGDWQLERNASGVKSYVRWIEVSESQKVRERMGVMEVDCSADKVIRLLTDFKSTEIWMAGIRENYCLKQISSSEWYAYTLFDIPWPFEKRDLVSNFKVVQSDNRNNALITISSKDHYIPEKSKINRVTDYTAKWTIAGIGKNKVSVSFSAFAIASPIFPRYIIDPIMVRMFHNNLVNLKEMLEAEN
jgi:hypothetical protein